MTTVRDIITDALNDIGVIAHNETPSAEDIALGLRVLNRMIDTWQTEELLIYNVVNQVFPFVAGQQSYTVGTGGDFNIPRPVNIQRAYARDTQGNDYPIEIVNVDEWSSITVKYISTTIPCFMYDNNDIPLKSLYFWPKPSDASWSVSLWYWGLIQSFSNVSDVIVLPPGYEKMIEYNLAVELAPKFSSAISDDIKQLAISSKAQVKRGNYTINQLDMPAQLPGTSRNNYSIADFLSGV